MLQNLPSLLKTLVNIGIISPNEAVEIAKLALEVLDGIGQKPRFDGQIELKFNQNHDPENGRFTFGKSTISSNYGMRTNPINPKQEKHHQGVNFAIPKNTPIPSVSDGKVISSGFGKPGTGYNGYGNYIAIANKDSSISLYAHLSGDFKPLLPGTQVSKADIIGYSGNTGTSIGPKGGYHLHYEKRTGNYSNDGYTSPENRTPPSQNEIEFLDNFFTNKSLSTPYF